MAEAALVTGGARRIGRAVALGLAGRGYDVAVHYGTSAEAARELCREIEALGRRAEAFQADLQDPEAVPALVPAVGERFGGLAVLVNNASIFEPGTFAEADLGDLDRNLAVHLAAPYALMRGFAARGRPGCVVNVLDTRIARPGTGYFAYTLSKKALADLTRMAAAALAPEVRVNGVCPGLILPPPGRDRAYLERLAPTVPLERVGDPADVVDAVLYLVGAGYVTGQLIYLDGGAHLA